MNELLLITRIGGNERLAGRLLERLSGRVGPKGLGLDVDTSSNQRISVDLLIERTKNCKLVLLLIGTAEAQPTLDEVQIAVTTALAQHIPVLPILVGDDIAPPAEGRLADLLGLAHFRPVPIRDASFDSDVGEIISIVARSIPAVAAQGAPQETPGTQVRNWLLRLGLPGILVLLIASAWWQWDHIRQLPGVDWILGAMSREKLPQAVPGKFNVAIAHLEGDEGHALEKVIRESLAEFPGISVLSFDREISLEGGVRDKRANEAHEYARSLLKESGADVLVWGMVHDGKIRGAATPRLFWTPATQVSAAPPSRPYLVTEALNLEPMFWRDLTKVLGLLIATSDTEFLALRGKYREDKLTPFIERVRVLLDSGTALEWSPGTRGQVQSILGKAYVSQAIDSGRVEPLEEARQAFNKAIAELSRKDSPVEWASAQNGLGVAVATLAKRSPGVTRLREAISIYQTALLERTREKTPQEWAATRNNLANAQAALAERTLDAGLLQQALDGFDEVLQVFSHEKAPLDWASTQHNRGTALVGLGRLTASPVQLNEALDAYDAASVEYKQASTPLAWAMIRNNVGITRAALGTWTNDPATLREAIRAYNEALTERTRERAPTLWATTQANLGSAYATLGRLERDSTLIRRGVEMLHAGMKVNTRASQPLEWAIAQSNLGTSHAYLGELESDPFQLREAVDCYQAVLDEYTREAAPISWALTQNNIGSAREIRGELESDKKLLTEAAGAYMLAASAFRESRATKLSEDARRNLARVQGKIARFR